MELKRKNCIEKEVRLADGTDVIVTNDFKYLEDKKGVVWEDIDTAGHQYDSFGYYVLDKEDRYVIDDDSVIAEVVGIEGRWR